MPLQSRRSPDGATQDVTRDSFMALFRLSKSHIDPAAAVLNRAFENDPVRTYFFPRPAELAERAIHVDRLVLRYGIRYGEAYAPSPDLEGVAVWLPSTRADMTPWRTLRSGALSIAVNLGKDGGRRMKYFGDGMHAVHKRLAPFRHWYLEVLGVDPPHQGEGHASTLLRAMFARADDEGLPCYLETQDARNVSIYQHLGFVVVEEFTVPGLPFRNWAMLRGMPRTD